MDVVSLHKKEEMKNIEIKYRCAAHVTLYRHYQRLYNFFWTFLKTIVFKIMCFDHLWIFYTKQTGPQVISIFATFHFWHKKFPIRFGLKWIHNGIKNWQKTFVVYSEIFKAFFVLMNQCLVNDFHCLVNVIKIFWYLYWCYETFNDVSMEKSG